MNTAIIVAGGSGIRFGRAGGKQLAPVMDMPVLAHTLIAFERCEAVDAIVLVTSPVDLERCREDVVALVGARKIVALVSGGETRMRSVSAGLAAAPTDTDLVAVHDGARAAIAPSTIAAAFEALLTRPGIDGVVVGHPALDTIKEVSRDGMVTSTLERSSLWVAQTPQVFRMSTIVDAYVRAASDGFEGTDDASLVEHAGGKVLMLEGPRSNLKVTVPEDMVILRALLRQDDGGRDDG